MYVQSLVQSHLCFTKGKSYIIFQNLIWTYTKPLQHIFFMTSVQHYDNILDIEAGDVPNPSRNSGNDRYFKMSLNDADNIACSMLFAIFQQNNRFPILMFNSLWLCYIYILFDMVINFHFYRLCCATFIWAISELNPNNTCLFQIHVKSKKKCFLVLSRQLHLRFKLLFLPPFNHVFRALFLMRMLHF